MLSEKISMCLCSQFLNITFMYGHHCCTLLRIFWKSFICRSSHPEVLCKKLCSFCICVKSLFNKIARVGPATLLKIRHQHRCFLVNFAKLLRALNFIVQLQTACSSAQRHSEIRHTRKTNILIKPSSTQVNLTASQYLTKRYCTLFDL